MNFYSVFTVFILNLALLLDPKELYMDQTNSFCVFKELMNLRQSKDRGVGSTDEQPYISC